MKHFHFIALFPDVIRTWMTSSIIGRARAAGLFDFSLYSLRDFSHDKHRSVDDTPYGGGGGMILRIEPLVEAVESVWKTVGRENSLTIGLSPAGRPLNQALVETLLPPQNEKTHLILVCGHYEGIDQRFLDHWVDFEVSMGDFVLTGGELPAAALADALIRQMDGALGAPSGSVTESFRLSKPGLGRLVEYPHYTKPAEFRGFRIPEILLSGHHEKIEEWRSDQALEKTRRYRPDLLTGHTEK